MARPLLSAAAFGRVAKALADPQRCEILEKIAASNAELSCTAIRESVELAQPTVSHHLRELAIAGLLERRQEGQFGMYRFVPEMMSRYVGELSRKMRVAETLTKPIGASSSARKPRARVRGLV